MDRARDIATGELVWASDAIARRLYRCPSCGQRVNVREPRFSFRVRHFAHAIGVADQNCKLYFPPTFRYSGRAAAYEYSSEADQLHHDHLELNVGPRGPLLALCLPPTGKGEWTGSVQFSAQRVSRQLKWHHLQRGQRIEFPLFDGRWSLTPNGVVALEYLESVQLGAQSLEAGANLFYVERALGRRVLPAESISCGESVRWLSRQPFQLPNELRSPIGVECEYQSNGWTLNRLAIPEQLSSVQLRVLTEWIQRRVAERRVRVWVESPFADAYTAQGAPIYPCNSTLKIRSDRTVDFKMRSVGTARVIQEVVDATECVLEANEEGHIELLVNDHHSDFFYIGAAGKPINALVRFAGAEFGDISCAQQSLDAVISSGRDRCPILVNVGHSAVAEILSAAQLNVESDDRVIRTELRPGSSLRFDNLGEVRWPLPAPALVEDAVSNARECQGEAPRLQERIRWLRSLAGHPTATSIRLRLPTPLAQLAPFASLATLSWSVRWAPHLRLLQRDLEKLHP